MPGESEQITSATTSGPLRPLAFLHLPKTAGTTLKDVIEAVYGADRVAFLKVGRGELEAFAGRPDAERRGFDVVAGHLRWDETGVLPGARVITMLREPIDRLISFYHYAAKTPGTELHEAIGRGLSFEDMARGGMLTVVGNQMVGMLRDPGATALGPAVASAKRNLESCAAFGLTERFDESVAVFARNLGWPRDAASKGWENRNVTVGRPAVADLDPEIVSLLKRQCAADLALHAHAAELFEREVAAGAGEDRDD